MAPVVQAYPITFPNTVDVDEDLDPRVAVDLATAEWTYYKYQQEMKYSWADMRPRVIRRLQQIHGLEQ